MLGSLLLRFWPEGFAQNLGYQSTARVIGQFSRSSASALPWLHNLPSLVELLAKNQLGP